MPAKSSTASVISALSLSLALSVVVFLAGETPAVKNPSGNQPALDEASLAALRAAIDTNPSAAKSLIAAAGSDWCQTMAVFERRFPDRAKVLAVCPIEGPCDNAGTRDASIPLPTDPLLTLRLKFNVFRNDDGSLPAATQAGVDAQVTQLNADFAPSRINFVYSTEFINSSQFRGFADAEEFAMKSAYADLPNEQINIYVVNIQGPYIGVGTFPWDPNALGTLGGVIIDDGAFGAGEKTLTHELGHNLGLWHTHHGVSEVNPCSDCWELAGGANGNIAGDFCIDTDPTPTNYNCSPPGGTDGCNGLPWGPTDPQNYMGYAPDFCYSEFSSQQWGRVHCWISEELTSWLAIGFSGAPLWGPNAVSVAFTYDSPLPTSAWDWHFGDGAVSALQNPSHDYGPGHFDVTLNVATDFGQLATFKEDYVTVWADTLRAGDIGAEVNTAGYWVLNGTNAVPIKEFILPITLTNVISIMFFDSISFMGTRLDYFESQQIVFDNRLFGQLAMRVTANIGGGAPPLPAGTGPIARIHYRTRVNAPLGSTSVMSTAQLGSYTLKATTVATNFVPVFQGATLTIAPPPCDCSAHGDIAENDGELNALDLAALIDHIFFSAPPPPQDPICPHLNRGDFNCDGMDDAVDLSRLIDAVFFGGQGACNPCACSPYPSNCP